ncbi:MAG: hypothetical protein QGI00_10800, partial [Candidatus Marinimicrobia bacterium]|nr:hypothetical protein [Candidatus Neomarinimicrobiota bacterium]
VGRNPEKIDAIHIIATSGMKMGMNVNVLYLGLVVNNPHPKDLSKSPAVAGFFVYRHLGQSIPLFIVPGSPPYFFSAFFTMT